MTIAERIDALEKELAKLKEQIKTDVIADYHNVDHNTAYALSFDNDTISCSPYSYPENTHYYYHTKEYAEMAKEMKEFNDKLLAFKWCYDRDYTPDWDDSSTCKYCVAYDNYSGQYVRHSWYGDKYPTVYFSTKEIAQKCCDWLNSEEGKK